MVKLPKLDRMKCRLYTCHVSRVDPCRDRNGLTLGAECREEKYCLLHLLSPSFPLLLQHPIPYAPYLMVVDPAPPASQPISYPPESESVQSDPIRGDSPSPSPSDSDYESSASQDDVSARSSRKGKQRRRKYDQPKRQPSEIGLLSNRARAVPPLVTWAMVERLGRQNEGFLLIGASQAAFAAINTLVKLLGERSAVPVSPP